MNKKIILLIDFDSTFVTVESLDQLADIVLQKRTDKESILRKIKDITKQGMEGKITFPQSLQSRLELFAPTHRDVEVLVGQLKKSITPSFKKYRDFFKRHQDCVYILSGGFTNYMVPVLEEFGIRRDHIVGNELLFTTDGLYSGYDTDNPLSQEKGKVKMVQRMKLQGEVCMVGDGYTDWEVKEAGFANKFIAFKENVSRQNVLEKADAVANNFEEVLQNL